MTSTAVLASVVIPAALGRGSGAFDRSRFSADVPAQAATADRAVDQRVEAIRDALLRLPY